MKRRVWMLIAAGPFAAFGGIAGLATTAGHAGAAASSYTTTSEYTAADFATGFTSKMENDDTGQSMIGGLIANPFDPSNAGIGPIGLAFDPQGNLLVGDIITGELFQFPAKGGVAGAPTLVKTLDPGLAGLAFSADHRLYAANQDDSTIDELNPTTGAVIRTVTKGVKCATGLAFDPVSGDLFASQGACANPIARVENPESASPKVVNYTSGTTYVDGLGFTPDGTLYAVDGPRGTSTALQTFAGTHAATPGKVLATVATIPYGDGMTFSKPINNATSPQYVYVNRNDGIVTRVDLTTTPHTMLNIMTGGTRGDFMTTGPDGCLYPTQSSSVARIGFTDGMCDGLPTTPTTPTTSTTTTSTTVAPTSTTAPTTTPAPTTTTPPAGGTGGNESPNPTSPATPSNTIEGSTTANAAPAPTPSPQLPLTGGNAMVGLAGAAMLALVLFGRRVQLHRETR